MSSATTTHEQYQATQKSGSRLAEARVAALVFVDNAGIARMKCIPAEHLDRAARFGIGISSVFSGVQGDDHFAPVPGIDSPSGDIRLVPDLEAAAPLRPTPGWIWVPVNQHDQEGKPWPGCQRTFVRRMEQRASEIGIELLCGFELEWSVGCEVDGCFLPIYAGPGYGAAALTRLAEYMLEVVEAATDAGIGVEQIHPEYSPGQVEISFSPASPVKACDQAILFRHFARTIAEQRGWRVSFSPVVSRELLGNGAHIHFSIWYDGVNQFAGGSGPAGLKQQGEAFLAGILTHLHALTALAAPSAISYERLQPSHWSGAYACWGHENREAALRLAKAIGPAAARTANVEWKSVDMAANPYLVVGSIIAAGLDGVARSLRLPAPVSVDPATLSERARKNLNITRLPSTLASATDAFASSTVLRDAMGSFLHDCVTLVRRGEATQATDRDINELVEQHRYRY